MRHEYFDIEVDPQFDSDPSDPFYVSRAECAVNIVMERNQNWPLSTKYSVVSDDGRVVRVRMSTPDAEPDLLGLRSWLHPHARWEA